MKTCNRCPDKGPQPLEAFLKDLGAPDGHRTICRACDAKRKRDRREKARKATGATPARAPQAANDAPTEDPLAEAYSEREKRSVLSKTKRQADALVKENEALKQKISDLQEMWKAPEIRVYKKPAHLRSDAVAVAVASDWHVEERVVASTVHGLNEYNLDIAKARAERFFKNTLRLVDIMARDSKITTLHMPFLGDLFSGYIHKELIMANQLPPGKAAWFARGLICSGIDFILRESSYEIDALGVPGNHGRMTEEGVWYSDPTGTSLETAMYQMIASRYDGNPRVRFEVADQAMVYRRFFESYKVRYIHGYEVNYGGGVGGITIPINKAIAQWNTPIAADLTLMGHFHQRFDGGNFIVNGSLIGYNTYAQKIKAKYQPPEQAFFLIHARGGGEKSIVAPIWVEEPVRAADLKVG